MRNGPKLNRQRQIAAGGLSNRLANVADLAKRELGGFDTSTDVRWFHDDPTAGADRDWAGPGYYLLEDEDGIALLGLTRTQADKAVKQIARSIRARVRTSRLPERRENAAKTAMTLLEVAKAVLGVVGAAAGVARDLKER